MLLRCRRPQSRQRNPSLLGDNAWVPCSPEPSSARPCIACHAAAPIAMIPYAFWRRADATWQWAIAGKIIEIPPYRWRLPRPAYVPGATSACLVSQGSFRHRNKLTAIQPWTRFLDLRHLRISWCYLPSALPHSIKGAERCLENRACPVVGETCNRTRCGRTNSPWPLRLLAYVTLSAISTWLSPDPYLSWDRMKFVCLFLAGIVVAQNLKRFSQVRWLVVLLVLSDLPPHCTLAGSTPTE